MKLENLVQDHIVYFSPYTLPLNYEKHLRKGLYRRSLEDHNLGNMSLTDKWNTIKIQIVVILTIWAKYFSQFIPYCWENHLATKWVLQHSTAIKHGFDLIYPLRPNNLFSMWKRHYLLSIFLVQSKKLLCHSLLLKRIKNSFFIGKWLKETLNKY